MRYAFVSGDIVHRCLYYKEDNGDDAAAVAGAGADAAAVHDGDDDEMMMVIMKAAFDYFCTNSKGAYFAIAVTQGLHNSSFSDLHMWHFHVVSRTRVYYSMTKLSSSPNQKRSIWSRTLFYIEYFLIQI